MKPEIIDRGRGPEIQGTRITVYSILDFVIEGWHPERIAEFFRIHPEEVQVAWDYIRAHTLEVVREYVKILERSERGNPPELQAKLDARHEQFLELVARVRAAKARGETDISPLIEEYRATPAQDTRRTQLSACSSICSTSTISAAPVGFAFPDKLKECPMLCASVIREK